MPGLDRASAEDELVVNVEGCASLDNRVCVRTGPGPFAPCEGVIKLTADDPADAMRLRVSVDADRPEELRIAGLRPDAIYRRQAHWNIAVPVSWDRVEIHRGATLTWSLAIVPAPREPEPLKAIRQALRERPTAEALRSVVTAAEALRGHAQMAALDVITQIDTKLAVSNDQPADLRSTTAAFELARDRGELERASCHARRALFYSTRDGDFERADHWRQELSELPTASARTQSRNLYQVGLLLRRLGDLHRARASFQTAYHQSVSINDLPNAIAAGIQLAALASALGREAEVETFLRQTESSAQLRCTDWVRALNTAAWSRLRAAALGRRTPDPIPDLEIARMLSGMRADDTDACYEPEIDEHIRIDLALAAIAEGWIGHAERLRSTLPAAWERSQDDRGFWLQQLDFELAIARNERGELTELVMHTVGANDNGNEPPAQLWLRAYSHGRALEALGLTDEALRAYERADSTLESISLQVDFDEGRDRVLWGRQPSSSRRIALLLAAGRPHDALCAARLARARANHLVDRAARVAALKPEARRHWTAAIADYERARKTIETLTARRWEVPTIELARLDAQLVEARRDRRVAAGRAERALGSAGGPTACSELREPEPGQLALVYFPLDEARWLGFAFDAAANVKAATIEPSGSSKLGPQLLAPFAELIRGADALRILPTGALWELPFATVPFEGRPLAASAEISYSLDLRPRPPKPASTHALVVGDPRGDLIGAAAEAAHVADLLEARDWAVVRLFGADAHAAAWREELSHAGLLHYAGHGEHAAFEGWGSSLRLARGGVVDVTDVLASDQVPAVVVLPACDTAAAGEPGLAGAMNMARAFILSGSEVVIAARGALDDSVGHDLTLRLYEAGTPTPASAAAALRTAQLAVADERAFDVFTLTR